jgi:hypothetical protein
MYPLWFDRYDPVVVVECMVGILGPLSAILSLDLLLRVEDDVKVCSHWELWEGLYWEVPNQYG